MGRCRARDALSIAQSAHDRERPEALIWGIERG